MDWTNVLSVPPNKLTLEVIEAILNNLSTVDPHQLSDDELRKLFELARFLINRLSNGTHGNVALAKGQFTSNNSKTQQNG